MIHLFVMLFRTSRESADISCRSPKLDRMRMDHEGKTYNLPVVLYPRVSSDRQDFELAVSRLAGV